MTHSSKRLLVALGAAALAVSVGACAFFGTKPDTPEQQITIDVALSLANGGCIQLGKALKPGEVKDLKQSLTVLAAIANQNSDPAAIATAVALTDPNVAPFAPAVHGIVTAAMIKLPPDARATTAALIIQGVAAQCAAGLPAVTASLCPIEDDAVRASPDVVALASRPLVHSKSRGKSTT